MTNIRASVVVVPRERFSCSLGALESVYENTSPAFELVYVDGGSPGPVRRRLETEAAERGFTLIRTDHYLSPNRARNIGFRGAHAEYVVFLDNDVHVQPGWLDKLIECADETGAAVVGPLTCIGQPMHDVIHLAGGDLRIVDEEQDDGALARRIHERMYLVGKHVSRLTSPLRREECRLAEFHCVLVRRTVLEDLGGLDERMLNTREHLDFCLEVARAGGSVWFEPESVVTYVPGPPFSLSDLPFFMLRWSDAWEERSLRSFREKWDLAEDDFFKQRVARLGWRRRHSLVKPLARRLTFGRGSYRLEQALGRLDRALNRSLTSRHARLERQTAA